MKPKRSRSALHSGHGFSAMTEQPSPPRFPGCPGDQLSCVALAAELDTGGLRWNFATAINFDDVELEFSVVVEGGGEVEHLAGSQIDRAKGGVKWFSHGDRIR